MSELDGIVVMPATASTTVQSGTDTVGASPSSSIASMHAAISADSADKSTLMFD
jgi:hypothetical protein